MEFNLACVVASLGGELHGDPTLVIAGLAPLQMAGPLDLSFLSHPQYQTQLATSRAACVIVGPAMKEVAIARGACIVTDQPYLYFARLTQWWKRHRDGAPQAGVHPSAVIDADAFVHPSASVGPLCVVEKGASIGAGSVLKSRVCVGAQCAVGARCILHSGVVLGADGFGFALNADAWEKIEQLGGVRIGNDVEIGANTCVDRGALQDTVIEDGVKLDNLIQIGHNVRIGRHTAIAGCAGIAGSTTIGAYCTIGGGAVILGHLHLADRVHVSAATVVTRSIREPGNYTGIYPVEKNAQWEKNAASLKQLYRLRERMRVLEEKVNKTERT